MAHPSSHVIGKLLPLHPQGFLLEYGNPNGVDIDLFASLSEPVAMAWVLGKIDMHITSITECRRLIAFLDPTVIEPLENGRFIDGDHESYDAMRELLHTTQPSPEAGMHLIRKSIAELNRAYAWWTEFSSSSTARGAQGLFMALSYCISYADGARRVLNEGLKPRAFAELRVIHRLLTEIRSHLTAAKNGTVATKQETQRLISQTERSLMGIDNV